MSGRQIPIAVDMAMLSKLWYFRLLDDRGRRHALADIAVALLKSDYPVVTDFLYRNSKGEQMMLPWHAVKGIDWHHAQINVSSFDSAQSVTKESLRSVVLLTRDVIDALVLDLHNRRATRANDLWLEEENGKLLLKAADISSLAAGLVRCQTFHGLAYVGSPTNLCRQLSAIVCHSLPQPEIIRAGGPTIMQIEHKCVNHVSC